MLEKNTSVGLNNVPFHFCEGPPSPDIRSALFTRLINAWQSTGFAWGAKIQDARHRRREAMSKRKAFEEFANGELIARLRELGLDVDRFYWGPKTISLRVALALVRMIDATPPKHVLEIGAGTSTAILAALSSAYDFSVLSIENHMPTIKYVQYLLGNIPAQEHLTMQLCKFKRFRCHDEAGGRYWWYDVDFSHATADFDFVFIDGPVESVVGRRGSLPAIVNRLAEDHLVVCDDLMNRPVGRECRAAWSRYFPEMTCEADAYAPRLARIRVPH